MASRLAAPLSGIAAGAITLGVAEVGALLLDRTVGSEGTPSPLLAVSSAFVDRTPAWLRDFAISTFGTNDKVALFIGMGLTLVVACALLGVLATRARTVGLLLFGLVGVVGMAAVLSRPGSAPVDVLPTLVGTLAGLWVLARLAQDAAGVTAYPGGAGRAGQPVASRRGVLAWGGGLTVLGTIGVLVGRTVSQAQETVQAARQELTRRLGGGPATANQVTIPPDADFEIDGLAPYVTPNDAFYRIDTALTVPQVNPDNWSLRVHGMVDTEIEMSFEDLLAEEMIETAVTLTCVSNPVGGGLVGNAVWTGWPIRELLARAGVQPDATMVLSTSTDGFTAGTPIEAVTDQRDAILAVWMNGEPLPPDHGFPVRMVVPGLYGYVSATKWLTDLEVTRYDQDRAYWTDRGWTALGPIRVQSRIDVPRPGGQVPAGDSVIAGVAWDQHVGIERVEVRVDEGDWQEADLSGEVNVDTWRQWRLDWAAEPGEHTISVRATNQEGDTQTEQRAGPLETDPNGATGWHTIDVAVG